MNASRLIVTLTAAAALAGLSRSVHAADPEPMADPFPATEATPASTGVIASEPAAREPTPYAPGYTRSNVVVGLKVGGAFSGAFNTLGTAFAPELELGALLPFAERALEVFLSGRWAAPSDEGTSAPDPRLPGDGVAHWKVTRNELSLGLGLRVRIPLASDLFRPYLAAGARLFLLRTHVSGSAGGEAFGGNDETGTAFGFLFQLGGELYVGPGALLLELAVNGAPLDQTILADTNASSFDVYLGYRFFF
ncbi:MAG: hypothetical protein U1F43_05045 [Myxococcota bacterium]